MVTDTLLWHRLDSPGHDACRLSLRDDGWLIEGSAAFRFEGETASLTYAVECDRGWRSRNGIVRGWAGPRTIDFKITRTSHGVWTMNDRNLNCLTGLLDLDLGFTPATNLLQLRRADLQIGQSLEVPVAWLDISAGTLEMLDQRYERRSAAEFWYEAPRFHYSAVLRVNASGFVVHYPELWKAEPGE